METFGNIAKLTELVDRFNRGEIDWHKIVDEKVAIQTHFVDYLGDSANDSDPYRESLLEHYNIWRRLGGHNVQLKDVMSAAQSLDTLLKSYADLYKITKPRS